MKHLLICLTFLIGLPAEALASNTPSKSDETANEKSLVELTKDKEAAKPMGCHCYGGNTCVFVILQYNFHVGGGMSVTEVVGWGTSCGAAYAEAMASL